KPAPGTPEIGQGRGCDARVRPGPRGRGQRSRGVDRVVSAWNRDLRFEPLPAERGAFGAERRIRGVEGESAVGAEGAQFGSVPHDGTGPGPSHEITKRFLQVSHRVVGR